jgi:hypothetical protein
MRSTVSNGFRFARGVLPYWRAIRSLAPAERETLLLRAVLLPERNAAREAWDDWRAEVGAPRAFFERNSTGLKGLLPVVQYAVQRHRLETDEAFAIYARAALLREELRLKIIREIVAELLDAFAQRGVSAIFTRGYPLAETVYPRADLRHCHGLYLLVDDVAAAADALGPNWTRLAKPMFTADGLMLRHPSRLPIWLSQRLLQIPGGDRMSQLARTRAIDAEFAGRSAWRLSPADALIDILAAAALTVTRGNLRWTVDSCYLIGAVGPSIWQPFLEAAAASRLALPLLHLLDYLQRKLEAPIPPWVIEGMSDIAGRDDDPDALDALLLAARTGSREKFSDILEGLPDRRSRLRLLRALLFPRPAPLRWKYSNLPAVLGPALYVLHPFLFLSRRLQRPVQTADDLLTSA